jgi:hypothetical protein
VPASTLITMHALIYVADNTYCDETGECSANVGSPDGELSLYKRDAAGVETLVCSAAMSGLLTDLGYNVVTATCTSPASTVSVSGDDRYVYQMLHYNSYYNPAGAVISYYHQRSTCGDPSARSYVRWVVPPAPPSARAVIGIWQ